MYYLFQILIGYKAKFLIAWLVRGLSTEYSIKNVFSGSLQYKYFGPSFDLWAFWNFLWTLYYLEAHWRSWSDLNFFFQTINTFIRLGAISRPRNINSKLSSTKGNMGWNPLLSNKNSIRSSSSSNISSSKGVFSNSLYGQSWLWKGNNKTSGILLYIFPRVVQGEALIFALRLVKQALSIRQIFLCPFHTT